MSFFTISCSNSVMMMFASTGPREPPILTPSVCTCTLDINIASDGLGIYRKDTFTGQYTNFDSFVPWRHKISWVRALIDRVHRICTPNKIKTELLLIGQFLSWNGFPKRIAKSLIKRFTTMAQNRAPDHCTNHLPNKPGYGLPSHSLVT